MRKHFSLLRRPSFFIALLLCVLLSILLSGFYISFRIFLLTPLIPPTLTIDYIFPAGASIRTLANDLQKMGMLKNPRYLQLLAYLQNNAQHLRTGEYLFLPGTTPNALLKQMVAGCVIQRQITFIEGKTFADMQLILNANPLIQHEFTTLNSRAIMQKIDPKQSAPEGLFFPDSYQYSAGTSDRQILLQAYQRMQKKLASSWQTRAMNLPYQNTYQALIAASIIEKEAQIASDRPKVANVIVHRLQKGMLLQMDSTVIYALGQAYHRPLKRIDLKVISPFNTYINMGLPPTPIAMPGFASIDAALHPASGNYLYFFARGDGSHQFSATYQEQKAAIIEYRPFQKLKMNPATP